MSSPLASIIIRCYNEREYIGKLLYGVFEQDEDDFEVIIIDSGSSDGTLDIVKQYPVTLILHIDPDKFTFGRALNYGCSVASGKFCVFTSAHAYPARSDWLERLLEKFEDDKVALVYGKQRGNEVTKFPEKRIFRKWFPEGDIDHQESPFCNNANAAIRRNVWKEYHYNETLTGLEDVDWAKRVRKAGWEISYASEATVIHVHDETPYEVYNRYRREAVAYSDILSVQKYTFMDFLKMFLYNTAADYVASAAHGEFYDRFGEIPRFRLMQFLGTYRGFTQSEPISKDLWHRFFYPTNNPKTNVETVYNAEEDITYSSRVEYE